jgi:DNA-binding beta-propeller fold protein YncE
MRHACFVAVLVGGLSATTDAQTFAGTIDLTGLGDPLAPAKPFGIAYEPDQDRLLVSIAGDFIGNNRAVAVIDPAADLVLSTIDVGLYPQDIAFAYDAGGALRYGAVANSSDGTVTIWDASLLPVATVVLPDPFGLGTCFPFGLAVLGDTLYVSTVDGSGDVHAIDLNTLSLDPAASFTTGFRFGGRMAVVGDELWVPTALYDAFFTGSEAGLWRHHPTAPPADPTVLLAAAFDGSGFPSGSSIELHPDGRVLFAGLDAGGRLQFLRADGSPDRAIDLEGVDGYDVAVSEDGKLAAVTGLAEGEVAVVDLVNEQLLVRLDVGGLGFAQPNAAVFAHGKLYVTVQGSEAVLVFDQLPDPAPLGRYAGSLVVDDSAPEAGGTVTVDLTGTDPGDTVGLVAGGGTGSGLLGGVAFEVGAAPRLVAIGTGSLQASFTLPPTVPNPGRGILLQGFSSDGLGGVELTRPAMVVLQ